MIVKSKMIIIKVIYCIYALLHVFIITSIFTCIGADKLWEEMDKMGSANFNQWLVLILYRSSLYFLPSFLIAFIKIDKRKNYRTRLLMWLNLSLFIYLLTKVVVYGCGLNLLFNIDLFGSLDNFIILTGYIFTFIMKKKIEVATSDTILGKNPNANNLLIKENGKNESNDKK